MEQQQLDLLGWAPPLPVRHAPFARGSETSEAAAKSIAPVLGLCESRVLNTIKFMGGATCDEVEVHTNMRHQNASARIVGLASRGLIVRTEEKRATRSGRKANVWRVK